jgi:hypothetical protein
MSIIELFGLILAIIIAVGIYGVIGYGFWRLAQMNTKLNPSSVGSQTKATRAILKFCRDHKRDNCIEIIQSCLHALEIGDVKTAVENYRQIHFGAYGFQDWFPPVVFEHEDGDYVWEVFRALCERWTRLMGMLCEGHRVS